MKNTVIFLLTALYLSLPMLAGNPNKQIVYHSVGDEMVLFIKPRKMDRVSGYGIAKTLSYDITLNTINDSVMVIYTLKADSPSLNIDSTAINDRYKFPNEPIYIVPDGKKWVYRISFYMQQSVFEGTFADSDKDLKLNVGSCDFAISSKRQKKESEVCQTALSIIILNRK